MTIREEVEAANARFARGLAEQDVDGVVSCYTDAARLMLPGQPIIQGRKAIEETIRAWAKDTPVILRFETDEVIADGSLVVDIGRIVGQTSTSKYVVIHERQADGSLRIAVDAASSNGASAGS